MTPTDSPKDGDFAAYLERQAKAIEPATELLPDLQVADAAPAGGQAADREDEFGSEEELTDAALDITDEELERQALADPGADGDPSTPE
jgi:hypothetical protein